MKLKKGDTVLVVSGDDRGRMGKILKVFPDKSRAVVEGVNFIKRHTRPSSRNQKGGIIEKEGSVNLSNLILYCTKCSSPTRPSFKIIESEGGEGKAKVRICRKCGEII
ncbi:MAG: 50S ribosomal protein L24 [candidate division Zixibacteria bacterium SM23_73_2]|nr:MAG: 50S ribosomal protein L24 [candidate division Zixibacteria bacterium SM23_73_2]